MFASRSARVWGYVAIGIAGALGLELIPALTLTNRSSAAPLALPAIILWALAIAGAAAWLVAFGALSYRSLDEFAREGTKFAWYWGGSLGLAASAPLFAFVALGGAHAIWPQSPVSPALWRAFVTGYGLPLLAQALGYGLCWIGWRAANR